VIWLGTTHVGQPARSVPLPAAMQLGVNSQGREENPTPLNSRGSIDAPLDSPRCSST
jgi:hypothetical protein